MTKYGYTVVETKHKGGNSYGPKVARVNGENTGVWSRDKDSKYPNFQDGEPLHEYLNRAGKEGWRVVGLSQSMPWEIIILEKWYE